MFCGYQSINSAKQKEENIVFFACYKILYLKNESAFSKI